MKRDHLQLVVRSARPEDRLPVLGFCQSTFSWGDYIAEVWEEWLANTSGQLLVGLMGAQPVAVMHVEILDGNVAWLEGMRVHPDWRGRRIAPALTEAACDYARKHGARVARLATSGSNVSAHKTMAHQGYAQTARFNQWSADSLPEEPAGVRLGNLEDVPQIQALWLQVTHRPASRSLVPDPHWRWHAMTDSRLTQLVASSHVWMAEQAVGLIEMSDGEEASDMALHALVGRGAELRAMAVHARRMAGGHRGGRVQANLENDGDLDAALIDAGYQLQGAMLVYERLL